MVILRSSRAGLVLVAVIAASCTRAPERDGGSAPPRPTSLTSTPPLTTVPPSSPAPGAPIVMTHSDPSDPAAWDEASRIAAAQDVGAVSRRSAQLPFMFQAERRTRCVLIHRGAIVTARGPEVAGAYLRDLGVVRGRGPGLEDVLWALWALDALPDVAPLPVEGYVHAPGDPRLEDVTASLQYDGTTARVVLHYFAPTKGDPPGAPGRQGAGASPGAAGGTALPGWRPPTIRPMLRLTLEIPERGAAAWLREEINWAEPA